MIRMIIKEDERDDDDEDEAKNDDDDDADGDDDGHDGVMKALDVFLITMSMMLVPVSVVRLTMMVTVMAMV